MAAANTSETSGQQHQQHQQTRPPAAPLTDGGGKIVPQSLSHVVIRTTAAALATMRAWYLALLDAEVTFENRQICFIGYDDEHHRIGLLATGAPAEAGVETDPATTTTNNTTTASSISNASALTRPPTALAHTAFVLRSLRDLAAFYRSRKQRGIEPSWCANHGPTTSMYYDDPDGNGVEVMVWNVIGRVAVDAYMATDDFRQNPVGVDFDPLEFVKRVESGEDELQIKKRPVVPPRSLPV